MSETVIAKYENSNKDALLGIFRLNIPKYFAVSEEYEFKDYLSLKSVTYYSVLQNGVLVGGVGYEYNSIDQSGRINWIFFHPDYFGKGLGKKAVDYCLTILQKDIRVKTLIVRTSQLVYPFFEKCGYRVIEIQKDYWARGLDLYLMERALDKK